MRNGESRVPETRLLVYCLVFWSRKLRVEFLQKRRVIAGGQARFFVQESENAKLSFDNVNARLIVRKVDECPVYFLLNIFLLLQFENMRIELRIWLSVAIAMIMDNCHLLLQFFIGVIDAKLFEGILAVNVHVKSSEIRITTHSLKVLEAIDIKYANEHFSTFGSVTILPCQALIHNRH